jgi:hypothetical protein
MRISKRIRGKKPLALDIPQTRLAALDLAQTWLTWPQGTALHPVPAEFADHGSKLSKTVLCVSALELLDMTRQIFNPACWITIDSTLNLRRINIYEPRQRTNHFRQCPRAWHNKNPYTDWVNTQGVRAESLHHIHHGRSPANAMVLAQLAPLTMIPNALVPAKLASASQLLERGCVGGIKAPTECASLPTCVLPLGQ